MRLSKILVEVDPTAPPDAAWDRAVALAERSRARLTLAHVVPNVPRSARDFVTAKVERELMAHRRELLQTLARGLRYVRANVAVLRGRPAVALIDEVRRGHYDLFLRAHDREPRRRFRRPFGPVDRQLFRHCPCPVWLVGPQARRLGPVICAIHAEPGNRVGEELNHRIMDVGFTVAEFLGARVLIVQAWSAFGEQVLHHHLPSSEVEEYVKAARDEAQQAFRALVGSLGERAEGAKTLLLQGEPEDVIPILASRRWASLVVMGTVARTGVPGLITGNTAERVLARLRGSVLAVRPPGFEALASAPQRVVSRRRAGRRAA